MDEPRKIYESNTGSALYDTLRHSVVIAEDNNKEAMRLQKMYYDRKVKERQFMVGDKVMVHFPIPHSINANQKFMKRWKGVYVITKKINSVNYEISNSVTEKRSIIHINRIRPASYAEKTLLRSKKSADLEDYFQDDSQTAISSAKGQYHDFNRQLKKCNEEDVPSKSVQCQENTSRSRQPCVKRGRGRPRKIPILLLDWRGSFYFNVFLEIFSVGLTDLRNLAFSW